MPRSRKLQTASKKRSKYRNLHRAVTQFAQRIGRACKALVRPFLLIAIISLTAVSAPRLHEQWLQSHVGDAVVFITSPKGALRQGRATGFQVTAPSGTVYTITNQHVCELAKDGVLMVGEKAKSGRMLPRRILEIDEEADLCLVEGLTGYGGLTIAGGYAVGDYNYVLGHPLGGPIDLMAGFLKQVKPIFIPLMEVNLDDCNGPGLTKRELPTLFGSFLVCFKERPAVLTNITIFAGNSGSPMVNAFGRVTGVVFAANTRTNQGYAVPLENVKRFLAAW